jgi:hypothetical protein
MNDDDAAVGGLSFIGSSMLVEGAMGWEDEGPWTDDAASRDSALSPTFGRVVLLLPLLDKSWLLDPPSSHISGLLSGPGSPRLDPAHG